MSREVQVRKIVLLPRFTSFAGADTFPTGPINVKQYASAIVTMWFGTPVGTTPAISVDFEESPDLTLWSTLASLTPTPGTELRQSISFGMEWMRVVVQLGGADPGYTGWCVGNFVTRVTN